VLLHRLDADARANVRRPPQKRAQVIMRNHHDAGIDRVRINGRQALQNVAAYQRAS
jgi:hypothetical protein